MGFAEDVTKGDRRAGLLALRDRLAAAIESEATARELAGLAARLADVLRELDSLPTAGEVSTVDDLAARRAHRLSDPDSSSRPASGG